MRADLFLKKTKIIKRRTNAKLALDNEIVYKNDILIKPSNKLKEGDILKINFYNKTITIKVISIDEKKPLYELIGEENKNGY